MERLDQWLNLNEAAQLVGCSRKTLYRYMTKGLLKYQKQANNRRYMLRKDIEELIPANTASRKGRAYSPLDNVQIEAKLDALINEIQAQREIFEKMIALYKPVSFADLVQKHGR